jgi:hypothetical protein
MTLFYIKVKRQSCVNLSNLMPDENPTKIYRTPDNIEWTLVQTFPSYEKLQKFRLKNQCNGQSRNAKWWRIRFPCKGKYMKNKCQFKLLAMKTIKQSYHVYKHGKHNHPPLKPRSSSECGIWKKSSVM